MDRSGGREQLSFLAKRIGADFQMREIVVPPRSERAYDDAEWRGALVVVESGMIELETMGGMRRRFICGDVLCLASLRLRVLRNSGQLPAVLSATSRRCRQA